ncbi:hypothetical protein T11_479 [Trichinella zimbabwensis]|uniref:Uncharacterized protein n=1 Tax=Trichinella zimbabwensis TaxID=268475 RepID=A0A0V1HJN6_9BILA|nr:hypothetical protein T11_479 [Trichinella zimbabwensis]
MCNSVTDSNNLSINNLQSVVVVVVIVELSIVVYLNKAFARLNKKTDLAIKIVNVTLAARMRYPGKEETSGTLEIIVRGRAIAVPEHYDGSRDWDEWLKHFEDAAAVNKWL